MIFKYQSTEPNQGMLSVDNHNFVNLLQPYCNPLQIDKAFCGVHSFFLPPRLVNKDNHKRYRIRVTNNILYSLYIDYSSPFKAHGIYRTNDRISPLFRSRVSEELLNNLHSSSDPFPRICSMLSSVITHLCRSYPFTGLLVDSSIFCSLNLPIPTHYIDGELSQVITDTDVPSLLAVNKLLMEYKSIPLRNLPASVLSNLDPINTSLPEILLSRFNQGSYLLLTATNHVYAGYLTHAFSRLNLNVETLPVCLFLIHSETKY